MFPNRLLCPLTACAALKMCNPVEKTKFNQLWEIRLFVAALLATVGCLAPKEEKPAPVLPYLFPQLMVQ